MQKVYFRGRRERPHKPRVENVGRSSLIHMGVVIGSSFRIGYGMKVLTDRDLGGFVQINVHCGLHLHILYMVEELGRHDL